MGTSWMATTTLLLLPLLISTSESSPVSAIEAVLKCLSRSTPSPVSVYTANTTSYTTVLHSTFQNLRITKSSALKPQLIIQPSRTTQVQASVICCKEHGIQLKVRSGGHDYEGLSYVSNEPFVMLDLAKLRSISVDVQADTAWVQAGATLGELYAKIAESSVIRGFPGGWCPPVGVGGQFSGGGIGNLMRKYGLAADNIVDAYIVDSNGKVLDRRSMGEDLFWAIRGGGAASFGVVLSWKIRLVYVPPTLTIFGIDRTLEQGATKLVSKWQKVAAELDERLYLESILQAVNSGANRTVKASFNALFLGTVDDLLPLMEEAFPELGLKRTDCREMNWNESVVTFANYIPVASGSFKFKSDFVKQPFPINGFRGLWKLLKEDVIGALIMEPFGGRMSEIAESEIPFPHRKGNLHIIQYVVLFEDETSLDWMNRLYGYMTPYVSKSPRAAYLNYRDLDLGRNRKFKTSYLEATSWGSKYYKGNFKRLAMVKTMVDRDNFFRNEQSIPLFL